MTKASLTIFWIVLGGCTSLWDPFKDLNPDNCVTSGNLCAPGYLCDSVMQRCVPTTPDMSLPSGSCVTGNPCGSGYRCDMVTQRCVMIPISPPLCGVSQLKNALSMANAASQPSAFTLDPKCAFTLTAPDNFWYGGNGLPAITNDITIEGNGATIGRDTQRVPFRLFFVAGGDPRTPMLARGSLTLHNLILAGGLAHGGDGGSDGMRGSGGGGGAGLGGLSMPKGTSTWQVSP